MKHLRKFPDAETRDEVLADIEYGVLSYTEGSGINIKPEGSSSVIDYSIPFYVENITNKINELYIHIQAEFEYSSDCESWEYTEAPLELDLNPGEKIYLRAEFINGGNNCTIAGMSKIGGNIMSLIYSDAFTGEERSFPNGDGYDGIFAGLFSESNSLIDASELILPATTLTESCYYGMFGGCLLLTTTPILPATILAADCYCSMFQDCTSLVAAPKLPAATLAAECYGSMFRGCTSLTAAPALPATTLTENCYNSMFRGCTSLERVSPFVATVLASNCYDGMYTGCEELIERVVPKGCNYNTIYNYVDPA